MAAEVLIYFTGFHIIKRHISKSVIACQHSGEGEDEVEDHPPREDKRPFDGSFAAMSGSYSQYSQFLKLVIYSDTSATIHSYYD